VPRIRVQVGGLFSSAGSGPAPLLPWLFLDPEDVLPEGVYTLPCESRGYMGETIELWNGRFRYWFYSDVVMVDRPELRYPLTGRYAVEDGVLLLDHPQLQDFRRTLATVNGIRVLWREDGLALWRKEKSVHSYAVLMKVAKPDDADNEEKRPSVALLEPGR
jgi:hypothetical protein